MSILLFFGVVSVVKLSCTSGFTSPKPHQNIRKFKAYRAIPDNHENQSQTRRNILTSTVLSPFLLFSPKCNAIDEQSLGTRTFRAVTQSDLGISVRKSIVRGAQVMDKIDQKWEQFSDDFSLGYERTRRDKRPEPKIIPPPLPLNEKISMDILAISDEVFLSLLPSISNQQLQETINTIKQTVQKSFERAGLKEETNLTHEQFNFLCYLHFKAYNDLILKNSIKFPPFKKEFEYMLGLRLVPILIGNSLYKSNKELKQSLLSSLQTIDTILQQSKQYGLVSLYERNTIDDDTINDWAQNLSNVQLSITLDGDATMNAQILLQEQGFRLYPDYLKFVITSVLKGNLVGFGQGVESEEYYMDTDYNTDPDKFEVKEVLLNVVIDSV